MRWESVPHDARTHAAVVFADTVGVIMGGARSPEIERFVAGDGGFFGATSPGPCQILDRSLTAADAVTAAFVNATAGTFLELDEGYRPTGHPAVQVIPAALAVAQARHATGVELLTAILAGYEVTARLFEAYGLTYPLHPHGHFGAVGAAVAVATLLGVDPGEPAAVAATLPLLSIWDACFEGATARNAWSGAAAATGITATRLAMAGFTGSRASTAVAFGELVGRPRAPEALTRPLKHGRLAVLDDYLKFHSACALSHAALDAVLQMPPLAHSGVEQVVVETVSNNLKLDRQAQHNTLSTRFSLPYAVAAAIVHGTTEPHVFEPDDRVFALAKRVTVRGADDLEAEWPAKAPARVTITTQSGSHTVRVDNPLGHHANPASSAAIAGKFDRLCARTDSRALHTRLLEVASERDCAELFRSAQ